MGRAVADQRTCRPQPYIFHDLPDQDVHAPPIGNDVVDVELKHVLVVSGSQKAHPDQRRMGKVELLARVSESQGSRFGNRVGRSAQVDHVKPGVNGAAHTLPQASGTGEEFGSQGFMPLQQRRVTLCQCATLSSPRIIRQSAM